jgi:uncharacterized protein (TIGR02453 family)
MRATNLIDLKPVLVFLSSLQKNNNREWFEQNRAKYETAKNQFEMLVDELILDYNSVEDLRGVTAKDCVMRIYRDVRFSKDKSPYRTSLGASIGPGGKRSTRMATYLHLEPHGKSMIAGGLYMPESAQLNAFRASIDRNASKFKKIVNDTEFKKYFGSIDANEKLKTAPQGYPKDHPEIDLLRLKQVTAARMFTDEEILSRQFATQAINTFTVMKPFLDYFNNVLGWK